MLSTAVLEYYSCVHSCTAVPKYRVPRYTQSTQVHSLDRVSNTAVCIHTAVYYSCSVYTAQYTPVYRYATAVYTAVQLSTQLQTAVCVHTQMYCTGQRFPNNKNLVFITRSCKWTFKIDRPDQRLQKFLDNECTCSANFWTKLWKFEDRI